MFYKSSSKTKLLVPIFSLISILIFLSIFIIGTYYSKIVSLGELNDRVTLSTYLSDTLHSLQKERGLSSGYLSDNKTGAFKIELSKQRKTSDIKIENLWHYVDMIECDRLRKQTRKMLQSLNKLKEIRKKTDTLKISSKEIVQLYSGITKSLLVMIVDITKESHIPSVTQNLIAYSEFLYLKEYVGLQRAQGVIILSQQKLDKESFIQFVNFLAIQKEREQSFLQYATQKMKRYYEITISKEVFHQITQMENMMIYKEMSNLQNIDAKEWYNMMTKKLDYLDTVGELIEKETTKKIQEELLDTKNFFLLVVFLLIISLAIFLFMLQSVLKLIKEEQRLRIVMDKYIISSITNLKGIITDVSEAFCKISHYSRDELIGKNHNIVRHPDMPAKAFEELWKNLKNGKGWSGKVKNRTKDGGFYWVYAHIEPLYNAQGKINSYISVRLDITENELLQLKIQAEEEKNRLNEQMMQQQHRLAQMGEMLSMIAHQWRQPLSAITAASGAISLKSKLHKLDDETANELALKIKEFSLHLSSTIDDFRNFFRPNKVAVTTDFEKIVNGVLSIIETSFEKYSIECHVEVKEIVPFSTYENEVKQVVLNLIKNAEDALVEAKVQNPKINIFIDKKELRVEDNAGGIKDEIIHNIFEPYFSTKTKKDGTGLGLYMSKIIIEDHCGGSLRVANGNEGAVFSIVLGEVV